MKGLNRVAFVAMLVLAPGAWAQQSQNQGSRSSDSGAGGGAFVKQAAETNAAEIAMAEVAQNRAASDEVKHYAKHLQQEHELANERLQQIADKKNVDLPDEPNAMHKQQAEQLSKLEGSAFDKAYVDAQVKGHQQAIQAFEQQGRSAPDAEIRNFAQMHLPTLREHLEQAKLLQKQVGMAGSPGQRQTRRQ